LLISQGLFENSKDMLK